jgi:hypothetical protein
VRPTGAAASEVIGTNKHWQAFYEARRPCLADLGRDGVPVPGRVAHKSAEPETAEAVARPSPIG